ncbi:MAG TPA: DUF2283 domain-containing protein, partial [Chloroflexi bacterium]|nr:DUF2283 domain-containing protein [Chloroflexota bacterium]
MRELHLSYDAEGDVLYISFAKGQKGSSVSLNDNIVLRFDAPTGEAVGLTLLDFSNLVHHPRPLPLSRLDDFPPELRQIVWRILTRPPVSLYLKIAPLPGQAEPVTTLRGDVTLEK